MYISILLKLLFLASITIFLSTRKDKKNTEYFPKQIWLTKDTLLFYWMFIFISLVSLFLSKTIPNIHFTIVVSLILTFLAGSVVFFAINVIIYKKSELSLEVIGAKTSDIYWVLIFIGIQLCVLVGFVLSKQVADNDYSQIFLVFATVPITFIFWPIIEEVFYQGMMFIPTSRIIGLKNSAIIISLLKSLAHFNYGVVELAINFFVFGLLSCYLYIKTRGILAPIILHSSINFLILIRDLKFFFVAP